VLKRILLSDKNQNRGKKRCASADCNTRSVKRRRVISAESLQVPANLEEDFIKLDDEFYTMCEKLYYCFFTDSFQARKWRRINPKPSSRIPALIPLVQLIPLQYVVDCEFKRFLYDVENAKSRTLRPKISLDLIKKFLTRVHAYIAFGLQAIAIGYSHDRNGSIRYLVFPEQQNNVNSVVPQKSRFDARVMEEFQKIEPNKTGTFLKRCVLIAHPGNSACLSREELRQVYCIMHRAESPFALVIAPRAEGPKALCIHLTPTGCTILSKDIHVSSEVSPSPLCCQIPFTVVDDMPCRVVDLLIHKK